MSFFVSGFSYRLTDFDHSDTSTSWNIIKVRSLFEIWRLKVITDLISWLMFSNLFTTSDPPKYSNSNSPILQIFVFVFWRGTRKHFHWSKKYFRPIKIFSCPPSINKNKDLENSNSNILEVPMSQKSYRIQIMFTWQYFAKQARDDSSLETM